MEKTEAAEKPPIMLYPSKFREAAYDSTVWRATAEAGITPKDVQKPEYWAHVAAKIKQADIIQVTAEDMSFYLDLFVVSATAKTVKTSVLHYIEFGAEPKDAEAEEQKGFEIKFRGARKWSVLRASDNSVLVENLATKDEAETWVKAQ